MKPCRGCGGPKGPGARRCYCQNCTPQTAAQSVKAYRKRHPERVKAAARKYNEENRELQNARSVAWHHKNPSRKLFQLAKSRAKKNSLDFGISLDDVKIPELCPVFGIPLVTGGGRGFTDNSPTLDRIDNTLGYIKGNVIVVSWRANRIKCDASLSELQQLLNFYSSLKS